MRAGELDRRIEFLDGTDIQDGFGETLTTWNVDFTVWGGLKHLSGTEKMSGDQEVASIDAEVRVRWRSAIRQQHRIRVDGQVFEIKAMKELGRREGLLISVAGIVG